MQKLIVLLFTLGVCSHQSWSQDLTDSSLVEHQEVIVTDEQTLHFSNSNLKQLNLERDNFLHISGQTFLENLSHVPGVQLLVTGTNVMKPVLRGMTLSRVWVGENFVKQEGQQWGIDHGLELDPFTEGNITIVKGPSNIIYGIDAVGGVIHIEKDNTDRVDTQNISLMSMYRSVNDLFGMYGQYKLTKGPFDMKVQASWQDYADYKVPADSFVYNTFRLPIDQRRLLNTAGRDINLSAMMSYEKNDWLVRAQATYFHQQAGLFKGAFGRPQSISLLHDESQRNIEEPLQLTQHQKYFFDIQKTFSHGTLQNITSVQFNNREEKSNHRHVFMTDNNALTMDLITFQNTLKYKHFWKNNQVTQFIYDLQLQDNKIMGYEFLIPQYHKNSHALAIHHGIYSVPKSKITLGLRGDVVNYQTFSADRYVSQNGVIDTLVAHQSLDRNYINLNAQVTWDYKMSQQSILQFNLSRINRTPNIAELASNGIHHGTFRHEQGNGHMKNEKGFTFDIGYVYSGKKWDMHITPYVYYFSQYIYLRPTAFFSTLQEAGQVYEYQQNPAMLTGLEYQLMWDYTDAIKGEFTVEYVYTRNIQSGRPLPLTPPLSLSKKFTYNVPMDQGVLKDVNITYYAQFVSAQNRVDVNERKTPAYHLHHFSLEKMFTLHQQRFKIDLEVKNIFNTAYFNHLSRYRILNMPETGRNIAFSVKYMI